MKDTQGVLDATSDQKQIAQWYKEYPACNWGIAGGRIDGADEFLIFIDVDTKHGKDGQQELDAVYAAYGKEPETFVVQTPSGGLHFYLKTMVRKSRYRARLHGCRHIDVKSEGGYVVLFDSETPEGPYRPISGTFGQFGNLEDWFGADAEMMVHGEDEKEYERRGRVRIHNGQWAFFVSWAGKLRADGLTGDDLSAALWHVAQERGDPVPDRWWIERIVEGYSKYPDSLSADDQSNADRFLASFREEVLHSTGLGWLTWSSRQWALDREDKRTTYMASELIPTIRYQATITEEKSRRAVLVRAAKMLASAGSRRSALSLATTAPEISKDPEDFDRDPLLFNCQNGTIDLRTGHLRQHSPADLITRIAPIDYDANAQCPLFLQFLDEITLGRDDLKQFLQTFFGYALTGMTGEQIFTVFYGNGGNGKSVLMNTITTIMGEYALETPVDTIAYKNQGGGPTNDLARFRGARLITARETNQGNRLDESLIKSLTGGDKIVARFLHKEFFEFRPIAKWVLFTNHKPQIRGGDDGIWRRLRLIPFDHKVTEDKRDKDLESRLLNEAPGVLNWIIEGALQWLNYGLADSETVMLATSTYRREEDKIADFIQEVCETGSGYHEQATPLYNAYHTWCQVSHEKPLSRKAFPALLEERGYRKEFMKKGTFYVGLRVSMEKKDNFSDSDF